MNGNGLIRPANVSPRPDRSVRITRVRITFGGLGMLRRTILALLLAGGFFAVAPGNAQAQYPGGVVSPDANTYGYPWGHAFSNRDL